MIVPEFWAEARVQYREPGKQVTVRRFGWSNDSQEAAQAHAELRANEALQRAILDASVPRRDRKVPYNGAEGMPIREEVIFRDDHCVITRNSYGALCLNSPNVLFADIDFDLDKINAREFLALIMSLLLGASIRIATGSLLAGIAVGVVVYFSWLVFRARQIARVNNKDSLQQRAMDRIHHFSKDAPDWSLRLYKTPAGLRVLVTHRTFAPDEPDVARFFTAIHVDPLYARMCRNQRCFRARVTAKPWRIGINQHMRPSPGVWPVHPQRLAVRNAWIEAYQAAAKNFAACEFVESLGASLVDADVQPVLELHDRLSQVNCNLPIA